LKVNVVTKPSRGPESCWRRRDFTEITGQIVRILGSLLFTWIWVPAGNTGGARVPPFSSMPIPEEFRELLKKNDRH
ncbi:MAG: DUF3703 domain-containing protein, partial [Nitrospiraceae bacterium]|nr:DUF3703 domain-containing protein [Nitrospiraceae bacterium]